MKLAGSIFTTALLTCSVLGYAGTGDTDSEKSSEVHQKQSVYRGPIFVMTGDDLNPVKVWDSEGNPVLDPYYALEKKGLALVGRDYSLRLDGGRFFSAGAEEYLGSNLKQADGQLTLEAYILPRTLHPKEAGCIIGYGPSRGDLLFALMQEKEKLIFNIGMIKPLKINLAKLASTKPFHLVLTVGKKEITYYANGKKIGTHPGIQTDFSTWKDGMLFFGNDASDTHPWRGWLERVSFYNKALEPQEVKNIATTFLEEVGDREPIPSMEFKGTLLSRSKYPMPWDEGFTYREVLTVCEYKVNKILRGEYKQDKIRVAEWVYVDRIFLTNSRKKIGSEYTLVVEELADNPQLSMTERADTLDLDIDAVTYYGLNHLVALPENERPKPPKKEK